MANPVSSPFSWEDYFNFVCGTGGVGGLLNGIAIDSTLFTSFLSDARMNVEEMREWNVLRAFDQSITWSPGDTYQTAHSLVNLAIPFGRWVEDNPIQVWDGNTQNPTILPVTLIPYDEQFWSYSTPYTAALDYTTMNLYFMGTAGQSWTVLLSYIGDYGDIIAKTSNNNVATTWIGFPARFDKFLGYDVAARYRLGVSYDDLAARNADDNGGASMRILTSMQKWDANLERSKIRNRDYMPPEFPIFVSRKINITP